jgi:LAO/AO transport system kinase
MTDVLKSYPFDYILIETVGVGQSEVEIVALADITVVVLVPESGDEIQSIKAGIMEIADAFVINKSDRDGADQFAKNIQSIAKDAKTPVFKTVATKGDGVSDLVNFIKAFEIQSSVKAHALAEKAWKLIQQKRMADIEITQLSQEIAEALSNPNFNLYKFAASKAKNS